MFCLNADYSTTRRIGSFQTGSGIQGDPLVLPAGPARVGDGGLRKLAYFKKGLRSDARIPALSHDADVPLPLITVITVVYNGNGTIEHTIRSVLNQTYENVEYIILDGGSTDGTLGIIRKYEHAIDYWASEPDAGIYDAMNKALSVATGDWLYFLNSDDVLVNCLHEIVARFTESSAIYYGDVYMPKRHKLYGGRFSRYRLMFANICHQAIFYPRKVFSKHLYNTKYTVLADHAFNIACYGDTAFRFVYLPKLISLYNDLSGHSYEAFDEAFERDRASLIARNFSAFMMLVYRVRMCPYYMKSWISRFLRRHIG